MVAPRSASPVRDTDNLITLNEIRASKDVGILFRPERGKDFAGHRNRLIKNCLIDNSDPASAVIDIQGATETITIADNNFAEPRVPAQRVVVRIGTRRRAASRSRTTAARGLRRRRTKGTDRPNFSPQRGSRTQRESDQ
jgi:hypothetical protein